MSLWIHKKYNKRLLFIWFHQSHGNTQWGGSRPVWAVTGKFFQKTRLKSFPAYQYAISCWCESWSWAPALHCDGLALVSSTSEVKGFTDKAKKISKGSTWFRTPVSIILIIAAWFEAPKSERLPKVSFLIKTIGLSCRSPLLFVGLIDWSSRNGNSSWLQNSVGALAHYQPPY